MIDRLRRFVRAITPEQRAVTPEQAVTDFFSAPVEAMPGLLRALYYQFPDHMAEQMTGGMPRAEYMQHYIRLLHVLPQLISEITAIQHTHPTDLNAELVEDKLKLQTLQIFESGQRVTIESPAARETATAILTWLVQQHYYSKEPQSFLSEMQSLNQRLKTGTASHHKHRGIGW